MCCIDLGELKAMYSTRTGLHSLFVNQTDMYGEEQYAAIKVNGV